MRKMMLGLMAAVMVCSMAACGSKQEIAAPAGTPAQTQSEAQKQENTGDSQVEITLWHATSGVDGEAIQKIADDFMAGCPDAKVTLVNQGGYLDSFSKLVASAKADQLPTTAQVYSSRLSWYTYKDLVEDLTPYMQAGGAGSTQEDYDDIPKMFFDDGIWGGKQYTMPLNKSMMVLYYNEGTLEEAGVEVPMTWEEWEAANKKLTKGTDGDGEPDVYGTVFINNLFMDTASWLKQCDGRTMNEETNELYSDTPETKEVIQSLNGTFRAKTVRFAGEGRNANVPMQQGRTAMCATSTSALPYIENDILEGVMISAAAFPAHKTNDQPYYGTNITVFNTGSKEQKQAAWDFIKFLTNTESIAHFAAQTGYIPVRRSTQHASVFAVVLAEKPIKQLCFDSTDNGFQGTRNIGGINALDALDEQPDLVFSGEKDLDSALRDARAIGEKATEEARNN